MQYGRHMHLVFFTYFTKCSFQSCFNSFNTEGIWLLTYCIAYVNVYKLLHKVCAGAIFQPSQTSRLCHLCGSIPAESGWIINAHILFFTDGGIIWDGFFLSSQWIHQLFKVSILFPDFASAERSADQDSWHSDIVALTLSGTLNPACLDTYSLMPFTHIAPGSHVYTMHRIAMCYIAAAYICSCRCYYCLCIFFFFFCLFVLLYNACVVSIWQWYPLNGCCEKN